MSKMNQVYGIGQGLINSLPPPVKFESAPTAAQDQYEVGQIAYTGTSGAYTFYIYAGAGIWKLLGTTLGTLFEVVGTGIVNVSTVDGIATISVNAPANVSNLTNHGVVVGRGTLPLGTTAVGISGTVLTGVTSSDPIFSSSPSVTGSLTAGTTLTASSGAVTATNGNFVSSSSGKGLLLNSPSTSGTASFPVIVNGRSGRATFTAVSIPANKDLTLTITNSSITSASTQILVSMSGATTGSALSIKRKTASPGSIAIVVTNGVGAVTSIADIQIEFLVINA
jgi:hypothetical protein